MKKIIVAIIASAAIASAYSVPKQTKKNDVHVDMYSGHSVYMASQLDFTRSSRVISNECAVAEMIAVAMKHIDAATMKKLTAEDGSIRAKMSEYNDHMLSSIDFALTSKQQASDSLLTAAKAYMLYRLYSNKRVDLWTNATKGISANKKKVSQ